MSLRNVVIAGDRKCGTTSAFQWLSDHPSVGTSTVKETVFPLSSAIPDDRHVGRFTPCSWPFSTTEAFS